MRFSKFVIPFIAIGIFLIIPLILSSPFILQLFVLIFLYALVCESWDLSMGYLGLFNFGHLAFFGMGAYFSGILSLYYGLPSWIAIVVGSLITFALGFVLSISTMRAGEYAFSIISFAFQNMFLYWVRSGGGPAPGEWGKKGLTLTGGTQGLGALIPIPSFQLGPITISSEFKVPAYYFTLIIFVIATYAMYKLTNSRFGIAAIALRDSKEYAIALGVNPLTYTAVFISISTFFAGLAGGLYAHIMGVVSPEIIGWSNVIIMCCIVEFGGLGTLFGPAAASFLLVSLTQYLTGLAAYKNIIIALIMLFTLLVWPTGMAGAAFWFKSKYLEKIKKAIFNWKHS
jgi:branched-chain amino acid transport system permease protein